mmetsp:Transcript_28794/g.66514  ORF Transcript_28794/g.66514 Transcript_28794/m.66514 type:complete len:216 (-) Transcript_28794:2338-2985(-)
MDVAGATPCVCAASQRVRGCLPEFLDADSDRRFNVPAPLTAPTLGLHCLDELRPWPQDLKEGAVTPTDHSCARHCRVLHVFASAHANDVFSAECGQVFVARNAEHQGSASLHCVTPGGPSLDGRSLGSRRTCTRTCVSVVSSPWPRQALMQLCVPPHCLEPKPTHNRSDSEVLVSCHVLAHKHNDVGGSSGRSVERLRCSHLSLRGLHNNVLVLD